MKDRYFAYCKVCDTIKEVQTRKVTCCNKSMEVRVLRATPSAKFELKGKK